MNTAKLFSKKKPPNQATMNNPKYQNFGLGEWNDLSYTTSMKLIHRNKKEGKRGSITHTDKGREIKIHYVTDEITQSHTDATYIGYKIVKVLYLNRKVNLTAQGEEYLQEILCYENPESLTFSSIN